MKETSMKKLTLAATLAVASLATTPVRAVDTTSPGASGNTPAAQMKKHDSQGAWKYTPGHKMQDKGPKENAPGASGYAPGHQSKSTGSDSGSSGSGTGTGGNN
jgi:hypothetical protein